MMLPLSVNEDEPELLFNFKSSLKVRSVFTSNEREPVFKSAPDVISIPPVLATFINKRPALTTLPFPIIC